MKNIIALAILLSSVAAFGQSEIKKEIKKEVKIENVDGKYNVTIITTENGETKTVTKTYDNLEEMKNDPEMGEMRVITLDQKGHNAFFFSDEDKGENQEIKVVIRQGEGHQEKEEDIHQFFFRSGEGNETTSHKIKVWVDENGQKHISKDGVEIDGDSWTSEDGKTYDIKKLDGKVMFLSEDEKGEFTFSDDKDIDVKIEVDGESGDSKKEIIIIQKADEDGTPEDKEIEKIVVKIVEELKIHLEEVEENEFSDIPGIDAKTLNLDELNYYPNPNSGKFILAFEAGNKPTEIKITDINGKEVYSENLTTFEGSYKKEIDLSGQKPGIYLLQILQGKKAKNKKIVIE